MLSIKNKSKFTSSANSKNTSMENLNLTNQMNKSNNSDNSRVANTGRIDQFKNPIIRGQKRHKISFAKKTNTINVESWKKLNAKMTMKPNKNRGCFVCSIF